MEVEGHVVGFGEDVEVDVVEFEEIVHFEGTCGGHDGLIFGVCVLDGEVWCWRVAE